MFCPSCGAQNPDDARVCKSCGRQINLTNTAAYLSTPEPASMRPDQLTPTDAYDALGSAYHTPATLADQSVVRRRPPIVPIVAVAVILLIGVAVAIVDPMRIMPWSAKGETQTSEPTKPESSEQTEEPANTTTDPSDSQDNNQSESATQNDSAYTNPKESIEVSNLQLTTDSVNRYVLTGTVSNLSQETYDVRLGFTGTKHSSDRYGEDATQDVKIYFDTITPFTTAQGNTLTVYDLRPGRYDFTLYPEWKSVEEALSDPVCEVEEIAYPDVQAYTRFDSDEGIKITNMVYTTDGKVTIDFVNQTDLYLDEAKVRIIAYKAEDLPAVRSTSGARPYGAIIDDASVSTLAPGDTGTFECRIGGGYSMVGVMDISLTVDRNKSSFN